MGQVRSVKADGMKTEIPSNNNCPSPRIGKIRVSTVGCLEVEYLAEIAIVQFPDQACAGLRNRENPLR